ncbi:MAG TPA: hypothetical protein PKH77_12395 [Anaerolineae bacterium]|nr:hypothetical protein [Anaerolineae bacterium]
MLKRVFIVGLATFLITACLNSPRGGAGDGGTASLVVERSMQTVQVATDSALPPYGVRVKAETAVLRITLSSSKKTAAERLADLQAAVAHVAAQAEADGAVSLGAGTTQQSGGYTGRGLTDSFISASTSSVTLQLTTDLAESTASLLDSLIVFQRFLDALALPETITVQPATIQAHLREPEQYRPELLQQVYRELEAIQAEYGQGVKFSVTNLHTGLKTMPLNDTEYYLYLDPVIVVNEF